MLCFSWVVAVVVAVVGCVRGGRGEVIFNLDSVLLGDCGCGCDCDAG